MFFFYIGKAGKNAHYWHLSLVLQQHTATGTISLDAQVGSRQAPAKRVARQKQSVVPPYLADSQNVYYNHIV